MTASHDTTPRSEPMCGSTIDWSAYRRDFRRDFDLEDDEFNRNYADVVDGLVRECPVAHGSAHGGHYFVSDYETVLSLATDAKTFSSASHGVLLDRIGNRAPMIPTELDPPGHRDWRRVLNPYFTPRYLASYEGGIRRECRELIAGFIDRGSCEAVAEFCAQLPGLFFFGDFVGFPRDRLAALREYANNAIWGSTPEVRGASYQAMSDSVKVYLDARREAPARGDVIDAILQATIGGEPASEDDQLQCAMTLAMGGLSTTTVVLAGGIEHFATHAEHRAAVRNDPAAMERAVEEILRLYSPAVVVARRATQATEIKGNPVAEGELVLLAVGAACRDPRLVDQPRQFHLHDTVRAHVAFGLGPHRCIGSHLARLETRVAMEEIIAHLDDLELDGEPTFVTGLLRDCTSLPIRFRPVPGGVA